MGAVGAGGTWAPHLPAKRLTAGKAYFISDGHPINNFEFVEAALGFAPRSLFLVNVPAAPAYGFALLCEWMYRLLAALPRGPWSRWEFDLALTRAEVCKVRACMCSVSVKNCVCACGVFP